MMCPNCAWAWSWSEDPTPYCPYCSEVGETTPDEPPEAECAVAQADGSMMENENAASSA